MKRLVFDVPRWHLYLRRDVMGLPPAEKADDGLTQLADECFERLYAGDAERLPDKARHRELATWADELHAAFDARPDFGRLKTEVRGDAVAAAIATEKLLEDLGPKVPEQSQLRRRIAKSCERASCAVEEYRDAADGLRGVGFGSAPGEHSSKEGAAYRHVATHLRRDERLKRIAVLAGRMKRIAQAKRRQRVHHGSDEVNDVEQGGEVARLLPAELSKLARPALRRAVLRDVLEHQAMQYRLSGTERLGRGPLVVCIDKSGSMDGDRDIWATAVTLALLELAQLERRTFVLLPFEVGVRAVFTVKPGEQLPAEALFIQASGGTDVSHVVRSGLDVIQRAPGTLKHADIVLVTDGASDIDDANALKQRADAVGVTVLGVGIGVTASSLEPWCHEVQVISSLDTLDESTASMLFQRKAEPRR